MTHLTPEQLVDMAEGHAQDALVSHVLACAECRRQLADLNAMMSTLVDAEAELMPEPPPLFWAQFRQQVRNRIADADQGAVVRGSSLVNRIQRWVMRPGVVLPIAAAATLVVLALRFSAPALPAVPGPGLPAASSAATGGLPPVSTVELLHDAATDEDPSLRLVADLTIGIDWDAARDAGLVPAGSAEHAVTHLSDDELRELRRLLEQELGS